jgi:hypothetical protein
MKAVPRNSRALLIRRRFFDREGKSERRTFCPCELCRLRCNRMLYNRFRSGDPLRTYRRRPR